MFTAFRTVGVLCGCILAASETKAQEVAADGAPQLTDLVEAIEAMGGDLDDGPARFSVREYTTELADAAAQAAYVEPSLSAFVFTRLFEVRSAPPRLRLDVEYIAANPELSFVAGVRQQLCWSGSEYREIVHGQDGYVSMMIDTKPAPVLYEPAALLTWIGHGLWDSPGVVNPASVFGAPGTIIRGPDRRDDGRWRWSFAVGEDGGTISTLLYDVVLGRADTGTWRVEELDQYAFADDRTEAMRRDGDFGREDSFPTCRLTMQAPWDPIDPRRSLRATAEILTPAPDGACGMLYLQRLSAPAPEAYRPETFAPAVPSNAAVADQRYGFARRPDAAQLNCDGRLLQLSKRPDSPDAFAGDVGDDLEQWCEHSEWGFVVVPSSGRFIKASEELTDDERQELEETAPTDRVPTVVMGAQDGVIRRPVMLSDARLEIRQSFLIRNDGSAVRRIVDVQTSCHCTGVDVDHDPIEPGRSARVEIRTELGAVGPYRYTATLTCDDGTTTVLTVAGRAERSNELRTILSTPFTDPRDRVRVRLMSISTGAELARAPLHWTLPEGVHVEDGAWYLVEKAIEPRLRPERCVRTAWLDFSAYTGPYPATIEVRSENGAKGAFTILGPDPLAPKISARR